MILQALVEHYEDLAAQGKLARPGWSDTNISYALYIDSSGELEQAVSLKQEQERGKKKVLAPRPMSLPAPGQALQRSGFQLFVGQLQLHPGDRRKGKAPAQFGVLFRLQSAPSSGFRQCGQPCGPGCAGLF